MTQAKTPVCVWRGDRAVAQVSKPAVSRVSNPQTLRRLQSLGTGDGSANWKSAIQQVWKPALRPKGARQILRLCRGSLLLLCVRISRKTSLHVLQCGFERFLDLGRAHIAA